MYKITKILGQRTASIQKQNYNGHSKIVNFANLKKYHADKHLINEPQVQSQEKDSTMKKDVSTAKTHVEKYVEVARKQSQAQAQGENNQEKVKQKRRVHVPNPEFERITRSKKHISEIYTEATRRALAKEAPLLRPQYLIPKSTAFMSSTALSYAEVTKKSLNLNVLPEKSKITNLIKENVEKDVKADVKSDEKFNLTWTEDKKWNKLFEIKQNDATPLHFDKWGLPIKEWESHNLNQLKVKDQGDNN